MGSRPAHFIAEADGTFTPTRVLRSRWGEDMLNGPVRSSRRRPPSSSSRPAWPIFAPGSG